MIRVSVLIATTDGPVQVQRLAEEDPEVRSVICLNGTSEALPISGAYDAFVRKPTGVIERLFGHSVFRMDVSARVSDGRSWQLGVFAAHALYDRSMLAGRLEDATHVLWLTGEVNNDLEVGSVEHVAKKIERSAETLSGFFDEGGTVLLGYPKGNEAEVERVLGKDPGFKNMTLQPIPMESTDDLLAALPREAEAAASKAAQAAASGQKLTPTGKGRLRAVWVAGALTVAVAGVFGWDVFGEVSRWQAMAEEGAFAKLLSDMEVRRKSTCMTCRAAAAVYPVVVGLGGPGKGDLELTANEVRAPEGRSCALVKFGRAYGEETALDMASIGRFADSPADGLCGMVYRLRNASSAPFHGWLNVRPRLGRIAGARARRGTEHAQLAPGETLTVRVRVPDWLRSNVTYAVRAVAGEGPSDDVTRWVASGSGDARFGLVGLIERLMVHEIRLNGK